MAQLIPQTFIDELLTRIDIVEIISTRVKLRRAGSNWVGLCPFHTEKTPSFTVSPTKQFFHCFGCRAHGSAISFIMQFEHLDFVAAVETLAQQSGLTLPTTTGFSKQTPHKELYQLMEQATQLFERHLTQVTRATAYLKSRGITGEVWKKFRLGYAPPSWNNLQALYRSSATSKQQLLTTGLLIAKDNKTYARFRDRIIFPIRNRRGAITGFGGRTLNNRDSAKYLNSPETMLFHKSEELYGLYEAKQATNQFKSIIVVEGYLDVIALAQFEITNVVATLGTAISTKQLQTLLRITNTIIFCFDGDSAGRAAAWRACENSLPLLHDGMQIKFLFLPEGEDPDSLVRQEGQENFSQRLTTAISLADFFLNQLTAAININSMEGKAKLAKTGATWLAKMPPSVFKELLFKKIAELANISREELHHVELEHSTAKVNAKPITNSTTNIATTIQNAIGILLAQPQLARQFNELDELKTVQLKGIELLLELITLLREQPTMPLAAILEHWREREEFELLSTLACKKPIIAPENLKNEFIGIIQLLRQIEREQTIETSLLKAATEGLSVAERQELQNLIAAAKHRIN